MNMSTTNDYEDQNSPFKRELRPIRALMKVHNRS